MNTTTTTDIDLDNIYDYVDSLLKSSNFEELDNLLCHLTLNIHTIDLDIILEYLTSTYPAKSKLKTRQLFLDKAKEIYTEKGLWSGL